ncbi:MAG: AraC family transcriptional regulator [Neisseria sp.]|uniref:AraC family transcriptional regulator n=1 Tax=Neisseria sp. TaxID=192066 RepID=UPI0026DBAF10|nr:AraC family transcriptional regulator [Neisseria sp.]MDO4247827.1 AraC family transcriptional regulator [Neisseria sp.]
MNHPEPSLSQSMAAAYQTLARLAEKIARNDGKTATAVSSLSVYRHSTPVYSLPCLYPQGLVLALQGSKTVCCGQDSLTYRVGECLFAGADLSALSYVPECCPTQPYLGLVIELDWHLLARAAAELPDGGASGHGGIPLAIVPADEKLLAAVARLLELTGEPDLLPHLAPLIEAEIAYRLLSGASRAHLRRMLTARSQQISRVAAWLKQHYREKTSLSDLAAMAHMSESSFRQHFRRLIGTSPMQYQKQLRLQQARQLLLSEHITAAQAAAAVGYESPSQFSREYRRFFGLPPAADTGR